MTEQPLDPYEADLLAGLDEPEDADEPEEQADIPVTPALPQNPSARRPTTPPSSLADAVASDAEFRGAVLRGLAGLNLKLERLVIATERQQAPKVAWPAAPVQGVAAGGAWVCPIHGTSKVVPAGISKKPPYKPYQAFTVCSEQGCQERPPKVA